VFVTADPSKQDPYGNQIEWLSSVTHHKVTTAPGRYWFHPDEPKP
jgi:hypothetical protein